jgi:small subunit ribosomal protein S8e
MSVWHGDQHKRKPTGGKRRPYRKKRRFERGSFPTETMLGEPARKISRRRGGNIKVRVLSDKYACVTDPATGKTQKAEIIRVVKNPANVDYDRRGVITKGAVIETSMGLARVTSRPGQNGVINAILVEKE